MPQRQQTGAVFLMVMLLFWLLFPEGNYSGSPGLIFSDIAAAKLRGYNAALDLLNRTSWGDFKPVASSINDTSDDVGPGFLNLTGFRHIDGFNWDDLGRFRERTLRMSHHAFTEVDGKYPWDRGQGAHVWMNTSGTLHGDWVFRAGSSPRTVASYNLSRTAPAMAWLEEGVEWGRNVTGPEGKMLLRITGNRTMSTYLPMTQEESELSSGGVIRNVKATMTIEDSAGSGHTWDMRLWGLHWPRQGVIMMTTTSEKFQGIFGLPHLAPSADYFKSGQTFLSQRLAKVLARKERTIRYDQVLPFNSDIVAGDMINPMPQCEYVLYAQIHPPDPDTLLSRHHKLEDVDMGAVIRAIEEELAFPLGAPIGRIPTLRMSTILYSPDCGYFLESKGPPDFAAGEFNHLSGMKVEVHTHEIKSWMLLFACVMLGQVYLLKNQIGETFTPSTVGRVSFWTISAMVLVDGMTFTAAATWVSSAGATFLPTLALMFVAFLSMSIGGSFLSRIFDVHVPTRRPETNTNSGAGTGQQTPAPQTGTLLPAPVSSNVFGGAPTIVALDGDVDAEVNGASAVPGLGGTAGAAPALTFQTIMGRFVLFGLILGFISLSSSTWYPGARSFYLNLCAFIYLSLWIPQIYRNAMRNCRRALTWSFVIGQSVLRLLPIAYFWLREDNFMFAITDRTTFAFLCAWVWIQLFILGAQDIVGPRFIIPAGWAPEAWDYHPILREDGLEAGGLPIGLINEDQPAGRRPSIQDKEAGASGSVRKIDCSICRENLDVPVIKEGDADMSVAGVLARRMYMVTPCRHIFHSACLESWMKFRLQCPICREDLPPL